MEDPTGILTDEDVVHSCDDMETEVSSIEVPLLEEVMEGDMVSSSKDSCIASNDIIAQESEEDDLCHWKAIVFAILIACVHILWQVKLVAFVERISWVFDAASGVDIEKNICGLDIIAKATKFVELNVVTDVASDPIAVSVSLEEEIGDGPEEKLSEGVLQLALQKEETTMTVPVPRSVFEVEYVPLWGFTSICGRRPEMEDAVAAVPRFVKVPIEMLIGDRVLNGMSKGFAHQTAHFFGVYDGHGGSQVANYCRDRLHSALSEQIEFAKECWSNGNVDAEIEGQGGHEPCCPRKQLVLLLLLPLFVLLISLYANCEIRGQFSVAGKSPWLCPWIINQIEKTNMKGSKQLEARLFNGNGHRVFGVLAMSRSIGDRYLKPWIIPEPEVMFVPRVKEDECLILASDERGEMIDPAAQAAARTPFEPSPPKRKQGQHHGTRVGSESSKEIQDQKAELLKSIKALVLLFDLKERKKRNQISNICRKLRLLNS
ncbi:hypothetical protein V6N13_062251 [Hibiscus sabdariffa]